MKENKVNPFSPFVAFLMIPFYIFMIDGLLYMPLKSNSLDYRFLWLNLRYYDKYMVMTLLLIITLISPRIITKIKKTRERREKKKKTKILKRVSYLKTYEKNLVFFVYSLLVSVSIFNPGLTLYIIINFIINVFIKKSFSQRGGKQ